MQQLTTFESWQCQQFLNKKTMRYTVVNHYVVGVLLEASLPVPVGQIIRGSALSRSFKMEYYKGNLFFTCPSYLQCCPTFY